MKFTKTKVTSTMKPKRSLKDILAGRSTVVNRNTPKTKPASMTRKATSNLKGNMFGKGWGG